MLKYQTDKKTVVREYLQHLFLSYFYQQDHTSGIYFKGGTALRIVYQSPRFSEDLDFSVDTRTLRTIALIESAVIGTLTALVKEGITAEIVEAKETTGGYLAIIDCHAYEMTLSIKLEMSLRKGKKAGSVATVASEYAPDYTVVQLEESQLVAEKIAALLDRKKPRDFYDFYFLLRHNLLPTKKGDTIRQVLDVLSASRIRFDTELKEFLPKSHHMIIRDFKTMLEREINRYI